MKKLINKAESFIKETIEGIVLAHPESLKAVEEKQDIKVAFEKAYQAAKQGVENTKLIKSVRYLKHDHDNKPMLILSDDYLP